MIYEITLHIKHSTILILIEDFEINDFFTYYS
jgi:hypothetical protein